MRVNRAMSDIVVSAELLGKIRELIDDILISIGVHTVLLIDDAGNIITNCGTPQSQFDYTSLAALAAANFGATSQIAKLIGEEDFTLLFHKGRKDSIHFTRVGEHLILITIFGDNISLGVVRLRIGQLVEEILKAFE